ncbi:MAG: hypothetical protein V3V81_07980 [Candidatus Bathyarchaeia archaeon]
MSEEKYCPLKFTTCPSVKIDGVGWACHKEKCAWWDSLAKSCAVLVIAKLGLDGSVFDEVEKEAKRRQ